MRVLWMLDCNPLSLTLVGPCPVFLVTAYCMNWMCSPACLRSIFSSTPDLNIQFKVTAYCKLQRRVSPLKE